MPKNRFVRRESPAKMVTVLVIAIAALFYFGFELSHIVGKPIVVVTSPVGNPYVATADSVVMQGTVKNADSLYVNGDEATIATDGSWQKNVLLQSGINTFDISAKKFLGGTADIVEQITYTPSALLHLRLLPLPPRQQSIKDFFT